MIFRMAFIAVSLAGLFYGLFHLATCTPFFKNKARVRRIAMRTVLAFLAIVATAMALGFITAVDHAI